jgi:hypothetical protein
VARLTDQNRRSNLPSDLEAVTAAILGPASSLPGAASHTDDLIAREIVADDCMRISQTAASTKARPGQAFDSSVRFSDTGVRENGTWRNIHAHASKSRGYERVASQTSH